ncbi:vesicle-associated protein 2-2 [Drosophila eugracilis]|uniref:vesicle-associated protein 2-2 n=1 Tax=Drosophila eugracilis TaxID=29029 RepID=UPI001BDA81E9|nr:vesicle-associated protein 2-2 [Drosophila eugracilis]
MNLLCVNPKLLTFYAPYDRSQRRILTLLNPTYKQVLFKVKSNAHRHYNVSPNAGKIEPYCTSEISIILNHFSFEENVSYNHLFTIQSIYAPGKHFNGETTLAIFRRVSRRKICSNIIPVRLEDKPLPLSKSSLESLSSFFKNSMERDLQLRPLCPHCPKRLEFLQGQKKPINSGHIYKLFIFGSLVAVVFTAYMQREQMYEIFINNLF